MDVASAVVVQEDMGTICYPNGDIFEGEVSVISGFPSGFAAFCVPYAEQLFWARQVFSFLDA